MNKIVPTFNDHPFEAVFLDLDGVFADIEKRVTELAGRPRHELDKKQFWKTVYSVRNFFFELELMPDALILWEYTKQFQPKFLTGAPSGKIAQEDKKRWVIEKFGHEWETIVLPRRDKQLHSGPNRVLIDDTLQNIEEWVAKGGYGIFHDGNVWKTIEKVEELRQAYYTGAAT